VNRNPTSRITASAMMVGAVTVLVTVLTVFLAYNANHGLPFTPTYNVVANVPNAQSLVDGNEVRVGGVRVGVVKKVEPAAGQDGSYSARLHLELDPALRPLPADSTVIVRNRSTIGLKYLELTQGAANEGIEEGGELPLSAARPDPVEIDDFFNMFDEPTRASSQASLTGFGNALAGRGPQLNGAIGELRSLVQSAGPVMASLARPGTGFGSFWRELSELGAEVAPVAEQQASLFVGLDATFGAFAEVARPYIQDTISKSPETLDAVVPRLVAIRPFLRHSAEMFAAFQPGADALAGAAPDLAVGVSRGVPAVREAFRVNNQIDPTAQAVLDFQNAAGVDNGLSLLSDTNRQLDPIFGYLAPSQTVCNYLALLFRNVGSIGAQGDGRGNWTRILTFAPAPGPNSEGVPASAPAKGPRVDNQLHYNPYPNTAAPGQTRECEAGNERYIAGRQVIGNVPGNQGTNTAAQDVGEKKTKKKAGKRKKKGAKKGGGR
jgi:virulence factor Mce-like protein